MQVPEDTGVLEHSKEQLSTCLVTAVYDHIIVLNHHVRPVCSTSLHSGKRSWCPHPLTLGNVVLSTPGHMSLLKLLLRPCPGSDLALAGGAGSPMRLLELCEPRRFHSLVVVLEAWRAVRGWV